MAEIRNLAVDRRDFAQRLPNWAIQNIMAHTEMPARLLSNALAGRLGKRSAAVPPGYRMVKRRADYFLFPAGSTLLKKGKANTSMYERLAIPNLTQEIDGFQFVSQDVRQAIAATGPVLDLNLDPDDD